MLTVGVAILNSMSRNQHIREFVLYDWGKRVTVLHDSERDNVLHDMLGRLPPDQRTKFTTGEYTRHGCPSPCIRLSVSGEY